MLFLTIATVVIINHDSPSMLKLLPFYSNNTHTKISLCFILQQIYIETFLQTNEKEDKRKLIIYNSIINYIYMYIHHHTCMLNEIS